MQTFALIVSGINAALTAAPGVAQLATKTKEWIDALFSAGIITKEQQDRLHAHCDAHMLATLNGQQPPELVIDPD